MSIMRQLFLCIIFTFLSACVTTHKSPAVVATTDDHQKEVSDAELGRKYLLGLSAQKNEATAFSYFKRDADNGNALSQNEVAYLYASGKGIEQNYQMALKYYQKAADQGLASAEYNVGFFYLHGLSVDVNKETAKEWLKKSADHGFEPAVLLLRQLSEGNAS